VDDSSSAINYVPSSENMIKIASFEKNGPEGAFWTNYDENTEEWSLLANKEINRHKIAPTKRVLFEYDWDNTNIYTCASLKAKFKTNLSDYLLKTGSYGLVLAVQGYKTDDTGANIREQEEYLFDCTEMYGDPYNYNIYFEHDIVFDLTNTLKDFKIDKI
jgi:hypothetical protein